MSLNITTTVAATTTRASNITIILTIVQQQFVDYLPLIFVIFGSIGFIGNALTFLHPELRSNTCCIYTFCSSIADVINILFNLLPLFLSRKYGISSPWSKMANLCKFYIFFLGFLPHLSVNFLLTSIIDRYTSTCKLGSFIYRLNQLKMVPSFILFTIITSSLASLRPAILYEYTTSCTTTQPLLNNILYIILQGVMPTVAMLIFVLLTFRNVRKSRQRVGGTIRTNCNRSRKQFITMVFTQVIATAVISFQWMIMYTYYYLPATSTKTTEERSIITFVYWLTNYCYYLISVKSFYISMLTSRLFRQTFTKTLIRMLPRHLRQKWQLSEANVFTMTMTRINRQNITAHAIDTAC